MLQALPKETEPSLPVVAQRLAKARNQIGWSQQMVAEALGVTRHTYQRWEGGEYAVPAKYHQRLCEVLKLKLSDFNPY